MSQAKTKTTNTAVNGQGPPIPKKVDDIIAHIKGCSVTGDIDADNAAAFNIAAACGHLDPGDWLRVRRELYGRFKAPKTELTQIYKSAKREHDRPDSSDIVRVIKKAGYVRIEFNELNDTVMVNGERLDDGMRATLVTLVQDEIPGMGIARTENAIIAHAYKNKVNPIKDFFNGISWDGAPRLDNFIEHLNLGTDELSHRMQSKIALKWLFGSVGKIENLDQNFMLVHDGPQGIGKSYWHRWLTPIDFHVEGPFDPSNKDHMIRLCSNMVWEIPELQAITRKADRESLKNSITETFVTERRPYGRESVKKPITTSMIGTINDTGAAFLNDPTGSRRFAVVHSPDIDWSYTRLDNLQIWAELKERYVAGETGQRTEGELAYCRQFNRNFEDTAPAVELFTAHFSFAVGKGTGQQVPSGRKCEWTASEIITELNHRGLSGIFAKNKADLEEYLRLVGIPRERDFGRSGGQKRAAPWVYRNIWANEWSP